MNIEKEFNKFFYSSQLKKAFTTPGTISGFKLSYERGAEKMLDSIKERYILTLKEK